MKNLTFFLYLFISFSISGFSQVNQALTATASQSGGGTTTYGPQNYNDGVISAPGTLPWGWVSTNGWIEYTWSNPVPINALVFYKDNRPMTTANIEYWDGSQYINFFNYNSAAAPYDSITFPTVYTSRIRINNVAGSNNPNHREIKALLNPVFPNDAGIEGITAPTAYCAGTHPITAIVRNFGGNQIDSVEIHWELNGVTQPTVYYQQLLDTVNGNFPYNAQITLGSVFLNPGEDTVKVYTSLPNGVADTINNNDTIVHIFESAASPSNVLFIPTGANSVSVSVTGGTGYYDYEYGLSGFTLGNGTSDSSATTQFSLTNLLSSSSYDFYLRSNCGNGDVSSYIGPFSFCTPYSAPMYNDFEAEALDAPPVCWSSKETYSASWVEVENLTGTGAPYSGTQALYLYGSSGTAGIDTLMAVSPPLIDLTAGDKRFRFFANSDDPSSQLIVGTMSSPNSSVLNPIDTITFPVPDTYQEVLVNFDSNNGYNGTDHHIYLQHSLGGASDYIRIDELYYEPIPSCIIPNNLVSSNLTSTSIDLSWIDPSSASEWIVEYGSVGFNLGNGIDTLVLTNPATISGLTPNTSYDLYLRSLCAPNDSSRWLGPISFETPCSPFSTPFVEDFESGSLPSCWKQGNANNEDWIIATSGGHVGSNGTINGSTISNGYFAYVDDSSPHSTNTTLISPLVDISALNVPILEFYRLSDNEGETNVTFTVDLWNGSSWNQVYFADTNSLNESWEKITINIDTNTVTGPVQVRFIIDELNGSDFDDDMAIDDVIIRETPTCLVPTDLEALSTTTHSAVVSWTDNSIATEWEIEYGTQSFTFGNGTRVISTTKPHTITGLNPNTNYDFYVRAVCGRNDSSLWAGPFSFRTTIALPFFEDFESFSAGTSSNPWPNDWVTTTSTDPNWESENSTGSNENTAGTGPLYDHTTFGTPGGIYMYMETTSGSAGDSASLISPPIYIDTNQSSVKLDYWYFNYGADINKMDVLLRYNGKDTLLTSYVGEQQISQSDNWRLGSHLLTGFEGTTVQIVFTGLRGNGGAGDIAVDDVSMTLMYPNDAGISSLVSPELICAGTVTPTVTLTNFGSNTLNSVDIIASVNGVSDTLSFTGNVPPNQSQNVNLNSYNFISGVFYDIQIYTSMPNGIVDTVNSNDTISFYNVRSGLSGNYTIDPAQPQSSTNYVSFTDLATDLGNYGVCGPVNITIAPGVYNEQVTLSEITGTNSTNQVVFDGLDSSMVIISHDGSVDRPTLLFDGADHVTFKNITIEATGSTGTALHLMNQSNHNLFTNNEFRVDTSSTSSSINNILATGSTTSSSSEGDNTNYTTFTNNLIKGGYYQVRIEGDASLMANGIHFIENVFSEGYATAFYADNLDSLQFNYNHISSSRMSPSAGDATMMYQLMNFEIIGNYMDVGEYGIYISDANSTVPASSRSKIINNMIISEDNEGILLFDAVDVDIYHNSVSVHGAPSAVRIDNALSNGLDIRNNIFISENSEALVYDNPASSILAMDHNIYYTENGSVLIELDGVTYADLTSFQSAYPSFDASSIEGLPIFAAANDLHIVNNLANNKGDNSVGVAFDIDGENRPLGSDTIVDIGADEIETISCAPPINFASMGETHNSALIYWSSSAAEFEIEYGSSGFTPGNGKFINSVNDTILLSDLNSNTVYDVFIRAICAPGDTSLWIGPFNFTTEYGIPYFENFEDFGISSTISTNGWTSSSASALDWESDNNTTSSSTGPEIDHTIGAGGIFVFLEASSGSTGDYADLISPEIHVDSAMDVIKLEFWYHKYGQTMGDLKVYVDTNGVSDSIAIIPGQTHTSETDEWTPYTAFLYGYGEQVIQLRFRGVRGSNFYSDMAIDDVMLREVPPFDAGLLSMSSPIEDIDYCYSGSEPIQLGIYNYGQDSLDFTVDSAFVTVNVSGAINATMVDTISNNNIHGSPLPTDSMINYTIGTINMSAPGTYYFDIGLAIGKDTILANNVYRDTVVVNAPSGGLISGNDTICTADTVNLSATNTVGAIKWQVLSGSGFIDVPGAFESDLRVGVDSTTSFRVMACNSAVSDTFTVVVMDLVAPMVMGDTVIVTCGDSGTAVLRASSSISNATYKWYDSPSSTTPVSTGDSLLYTVNTAAGVASQSIDTFFVSTSTGGGVANVGAPNNGQAGGYTLEAGLYFDVMAPSITINGVYVYPLGSGAGTVEIGVKETSTNNIIHSTTVNLTGSNPGIRTFVPLGFTIPSGNDYQLLMLNKSGGVTGLVRDGSAAITGGGFPFTIPGVISITSGQCCSNNATSSSYYYFYDWEVSSGCEGPRAMVVGQVDCLVDIDEVENNFANISIYPNPSKGIFHIVGDQVKEKVEISIYNSNGKMVYRSGDKLTNNFDEVIDISGLSKGMYFVKMQSESSMEMKKIIVQ